MSRLLTPRELIQLTERIMARDIRCPALRLSAQAIRLVEKHMNILQEEMPGVGAVARAAHQTADAPLEAFTRDCRAGDDDRTARQGKKRGRRMCFASMPSSSDQ